LFSGLLTSHPRSIRGQVILVCVRKYFLKNFLCLLLVWFRARASCTGQSNWGIRDSDSDFNSTTKGGANWRLRRTSSTKRTSSAERRSTALPFEVLAIVRQYRFKKKFNIEEREKQGEGARTTSEECTSHQKVLVRVFVFMIDSGGETNQKVAHHVRRDPQTDIQPALLPFRSFILRKHTTQNSSGPLEK
jgi:hypothetical protein